jgi:hypothetical protein
MPIPLRLTALARFSCFAALAGSLVSQPDRAHGPYLVVPVALEEDSGEGSKLLQLARSVAAFHKAALVPWNGASIPDLTGIFRSTRAENALFVVRKDDFDLHLHRRVLLASVDVDPDPFSDVAFGYLTGRDAAAASALWQRISDLHRRGLPNRTWIETAVAQQIRSFAAEGGIPAIARAAGFTGKRHYFGEIGADPEVLRYVDRHLTELQQASVITMGGNGDPTGIWLFDGARNLDRSKHWPYDPARVGEDPLGEMPRILAGSFRRLKLRAPVVWSGTCHLGATRRVFVECDIVSVFGRSDTVALYEMEPEESLCLALLDAGAAALLVAIGANHGMAVTREVHFALENGASLGEALKSTYDDLLLQCEGRLHLAFDREGETPDRREHVMRGGGANRALIGDPALRPFTRTRDPDRTVQIAASPRGMRVEIAVEKGFQAWDWDMYGDDRSNDWRTFVRVPLPAAGITGSGPVEAEVDAFDEAGQPAPHLLRHARVEDFHGRRFLHLQANGPRDRFAYKSRRVLFHVREAAGSDPARRSGGLPR